jgi:hypothetical protein
MPLERQYSSQLAGWIQRRRSHTILSSEPEVADYRDAETGNVETLHELRQRESAERLAIRRLNGFDPRNQCNGVILGAQRDHT